MVLTFQKWHMVVRNGADTYLLNMNSVVQMLGMCLQIKYRCDDIFWQQNIMISSHILFWCYFIKPTRTMRLHFICMFVTLNLTNVL